MDADLDALWDEYKRLQDQSLRDQLILHYSPLVKYVAGRVAKLLGLPLSVIPCERSKIDLFPDPLYFLPEGFPTPRNLTSALARLSARI